LSTSYIDYVDFLLEVKEHFIRNNAILRDKGKPEILERGSLKSKQQGVIR